MFELSLGSISLFRRTNWCDRTIINSKITIAKFLVTPILVRPRRRHFMENQWSCSVLATQLLSRTVGTAPIIL